MNSDLIVMTFDGEKKAQDVFDVLQAMRKNCLLSLDNAAVVTKDCAGTVRLYPQVNLSAAQQAAGSLPGLLSDLILGTAPDEVVRALVSLGLDDWFLEQTARTMGSNSSALLFLVRQDSLADRHELLDALGPFKGKIYQTTLSPQVEAHIISG